MSRGELMLMVWASGSLFLVVSFVSHCGNHGPKKVLQIGVEPPIQNGVGDSAQHGEGVHHEENA